MPDTREFTILINENDSGQRMDALVASRLPDCSRSLATALIRKGAIRVGRQARKPGYRLRLGDQVIGSIPPPETVSFEPEPIDLDILYEDAALIVINKAPGSVVHPAPGHYSGTLVNALLYHCPDLEGIGGELRPGIVHRLDKDTSGIIVVAKTASALAALADQFKSRTVRKTYLALVHGSMKTDSGQVSLPIGRHPTDRKRMSVASRNGKPAETLWRLREGFPELSLLEVDLKTGRTHQIRVHCAAIHHPLVGDPVYCSPKVGRNHSAPVLAMIRQMKRQMLHAWKIRLKHPASGEVMQFQAPLPSDMNELLTALQELNKGI